MVHQTFWIAFHILIITMLAWDLRPKKEHNTGLRNDIAWSIITVTIGLAVGVYVYLNTGAAESIKYYTAYVTELALSVDNLFVFMVIFSYFSVPFEYQHKTLFYGIIGAIVFRASFLLLGVELIERFHFVIYFFGAVLLYSAYKLMKGGVETTDPSANPFMKLARRFVPISEDYNGDSFLVHNDGVRMFTPLILVLLVIETTDIMFALDSVPAVLTITGDFFAAYTSNIMAIIGLRALYFVVNHAMGEMKHLGKGLALVLAYLGLKTFGTYFGLNIPTLWNMGIVLGTIGFFVVWSVVDKEAPSGATLSTDDFTN
jgi:tellurite resistance protein TerC